MRSLGTRGGAGVVVDAGDLIEPERHQPRRQARPDPLHAIGRLQHAPLKVELHRDLDARRGEGLAGGDDEDHVLVEGELGRQLQAVTRERPPSLPAVSPRQPRRRLLHSTDPVADTQHGVQLVRHGDARNVDATQREDASLVVSLDLRDEWRGIGHGDPSARPQEKPDAPPRELLASPSSLGAMSSATQRARLWRG